MEKYYPYFTPRNATGTGIGLYMAKMIVEKEMKGHIHVENRYTGVMFRICLPLARGGNDPKGQQRGS